jgi:hypothetical protein
MRSELIDKRATSLNDDDDDDHHQVSSPYHIWEGGQLPTFDILKLNSNLLRYELFYFH